VTSTATVDTPIFTTTVTMINPLHIHCGGFIGTVDITTKVLT